MSYLVGRDIRSKLHCNEPDFKEMIEMMQLEMDRIDSLSTLNMDRRTAKKRYNGIPNKEKKKKISVLDQYADIIKERCENCYIRIYEHGICGKTRL